MLAADGSVAGYVAAERLLLGNRMWQDNVELILLCL